MPVENLHWELQTVGRPKLPAVDQHGMLHDSSRHPPPFDFREYYWEAMVYLLIAIYFVVCAAPSQKDPFEANDHVDQEYHTRQPSNPVSGSMMMALFSVP
jgi:hypothetical protein